MPPSPPSPFSNSIAILLLLLTLSTLTHLATSQTYLFKEVRISYATTNAINTGEPLEIVLQFRPWSFNIAHGDKIFIEMPRFTRGTYIQGVEGGSAGSSLTVGNLEVGPSTRWDGEWEEGVYCTGCANPFPTSRIVLTLKSQNAAPDPFTLLYATLYRSNGISAFCGHGLNSELLRIGTDHTGTDQFMPITDSPLIGTGCEDRRNCNFQGTCDFCYNVCQCDEGYGKVGEVFDYVRIDCLDRICPSAKSIRDLPTSATEGHSVRECGNNGICDRISGKCECFVGWSGQSCERRACPNGCSGHGLCMSMREQSLMTNTFPLSTVSAVNEYGGDDTQRDTTAWDYDFIFGCVCDSSWTVGLGDTETQVAEYFGPDCSLKRCPSGDDPETPDVDETDCSGKLAEGGKGTGLDGNLCHHPCSGRGVCVYETGGIGKCRCTTGYLGFNCAAKSEFAGAGGNWVPFLG